MRFEPQAPSVIEAFVVLEPVERFRGNLAGYPLYRVVRRGHRACERGICPDVREEVVEGVDCRIRRDVALEVL